MQDVFAFRNRLIADYSSFSRSFVRIAADDISAAVNSEYEAGRYWPEPGAAAGQGKQLRFELLQKPAADHRRVREATRDLVSYEVTSCLPVDVLGVYVLLPASL